MWRGTDAQRRKIRSVELFLRTLQTGGDLAAQLEAMLEKRFYLSPASATTHASKVKACEKCAKVDQELERERRSRIQLEETCDAQNKKILELEKMLAATK